MEKAGDQGAHPGVHQTIPGRNMVRHMAQLAWHMWPELSIIYVDAYFTRHSLSTVYTLHVLLIKIVHIQWRTVRWSIILPYKRIVISRLKLNTLRALHVCASILELFSTNANSLFLTSNHSGPVDPPGYNRDGNRIMRMCTPNYFWEENELKIFGGQGCTSGPVDPKSSRIRKVSKNYRSPVETDINGQRRKGGYRRLQEPHRTSF